jgi:hypothetical protein
VFLISSGAYVFITVVFATFGKTSIQPWNTYWENKEPNDPKIQETGKNVIIHTQIF